MNIIDLSLPIDDTLVETHAATIKRITHAYGVEHFNEIVMAKQPGGKERFAKGERVAKPDEIPDAEMLSLEIVNSSVHMGTHVDAPIHIVPSGKSIEEIPLDAFVGPGAVIPV